jgi:hypothetical protein
MITQRIPSDTLAMLLRLAAKSDSGENWRMAQMVPLDGKANELSCFGKEPVQFTGIPTIIVNRQDLCAAALEYVEGLREAKHDTKVAQDRAQRMRTVLRSVSKVFRHLDILDHPCLTDEDRDFINTP